ncbi:Fc.00g066200.m01.CDS01 [Cosmosporella sp. VM-42]
MSDAALPVAIRSAVFYVLACTPCLKVRHRQKTRERSKKAAKEKARFEAEQPDLYQHPSPFNTNPYWQEEISMGPNPPKNTKTVSKNSSQRGLASSGRDSVAPSVSERTNVGGDSRSNIGSMVAINEDDGLPYDWNRRQGYQREDEELWGEWTGQKLMDAFSKARDSAGRLIDATLRIEKEVTDQDRRDFYFTPKNPPINDYHPPVVSSKIPSKNAHRWMLQPPPPAKIMEGKIPVSRGASSASKSSTRTLIGEEVNLGRMVHEKLVMEKLKKENSNPTPTETELIESLFITRDSRSLSFSRSRSMSFDASDDSLEKPFSRRQPARLRPAAVPPGYESSDEDDDEAISFSHSTLNPNRSMPPGHAAQRPNLPTIMSSGSFNSNRMSSKKKRRRSTRMKTLSGAASPVGDDSD